MTARDGHALTGSFDIAFRNDGLASFTSKIEHWFVGYYLYVLVVFNAVLVA